MITLKLKERGPEETKMSDGKSIGYHMEYTATIRQGKKCFSVRFGGSVHDYQHGKSPTLADVLYCLALDTMGSDEEFGNWCMDVGYDPDSISALKIYRACRKNAAKCRKIFSESRLERLSQLEGNESDGRVNEILWVR